MSDALYPPGGWARAVNYVYHRVKRLPDPPHRIARGIAVGIFVTFSPLFGLHIFLAMFLAWIVRGNVFAAMIATFIGNPVTFPFIAAVSLSVGNWLLDRDEVLVVREVFARFNEVGAELWWNVKSLFNDTVAHWDGIEHFNEDILLPYFLGGAVSGTLLAAASYWLSHALIDTYQRRRSRLLQKRLQERLASRATSPAE